MKQRILSGLLALCTLLTLLPMSTLAAEPPDSPGDETDPPPDAGTEVTEPAAITGITVEGELTWLFYQHGDLFNPDGLTVIASCDDGTEMDVTGQAVFNEGKPLTVDQTTVKVTFGGKEAVIENIIVEKKDIIFSPIWSESEFTYDGTEKTVTVSGFPEEVQVTYANNSGTDAGVYDAVAVFSLAEGYDPDCCNLMITEEHADLTIRKATPTGAPTCASITADGRTLADAPLDMGTLAPGEGTLVWTLGDSTPAERNTAYQWTFTPADSTNYNELTGQLTPYNYAAPTPDPDPVPPSGGSTDEDKPGTGQDKPGTGEDKPSTGGDTPSTGEDKPSTGGDKPSTGEDKPGTGEDKPSTGGDKPSTGEEKPSTGGDKPSTGGDKPSTGEDKPSTGGDKPGTGEDKPGTGEDKPSTGGDKPSTGGDKPSTGGDKPSTGGDKPSTGGDTPSTGGDKPSTGGDKPSTGGDKPVTGGDKPSTGGDKPVTGGDKPVTGEDKPSTGGDKPVTGEDKPSTGGDKPSTGGDKPSTGGDKPSTGEDKPVTGEDKPSTGGDKPSTGEDKPGTGGNKPVTSGGSTGSSSHPAISIQTTIEPSATIKGAAAAVQISSSTGSQIVNQAVKNNSAAVVIAPVIRGGVTSAQVTIPAAAVSGLSRRTDADVVVDTPVARVVIPNGALSGLSGNSLTVSADRQGSTLSVTVQSGGRTVDSVSGGLTVTAPASSPSGTVAVLVNDDGSREVIRKSAVLDGAINIPLKGSARVEIVANGKSFRDVPAASWACGAVAFVSGHELFIGTDEGVFSPNASMTRGMVAMVLHNLEHNPDSGRDSQFSDVAGGAWYAGAVSWAARQGIVYGYPDGSFGPGKEVTREQLAVMLYRYAGSPKTAAGSAGRFDDSSSISGYAREAMDWAVENGIINGVSVDRLDPGGLATRAQVAQMLKNFVEGQFQR